LAAGLAAVMQELKCRIDTFYASFTGNDVVAPNNWLRQLYPVELEEDSQDHS
jgi:hypothetical protein